ncbi:hypothetical protein [Spirosoma soli]
MNHKAIDPLIRKRAIAGMTGVCLYFKITLTELPDQLTFLL